MKGQDYASYKRLIFHIGLHKTGSSFLQAFLRANRDVLRKGGLHYPDFQNASKAAQHDGNHSIAVLHAETNAPTLLAGLARELPLAPPRGCDTLLISAEALANTKRTNRLVEELDAAGLIDRTEFIVYLRRYDELSESAYAEAVKAVLVGPLDEPVYQVGAGLFRRMQGIIRAVGPTALHVRPYNPALWPAGGLAEDFLTACGFSALWPKANPLARTERNVRLNRAETWLLSTVEGREEKRALQAWFAGHPVPGSRDDSKFFTSPADRAALNRQALDRDMATFTRLGITDPVAFLGLDRFDDQDSWRPFEPDHAALERYLAEFRRATGRDTAATGS